MDFDNLNARLDEEAETSASLRAQLQRAQADYQALKSKYDKEVTARVEEFEETRYTFLVCSGYHNSHIASVIGSVPVPFPMHYGQ